jgi:hypothetical protein
MNILSALMKREKKENFARFTLFPLPPPLRLSSGEGRETRRFASERELFPWKLALCLPEQVHPGREERKMFSAFLTSQPESHCRF